jgi:hypothetical protein
MYVSVVIKSEIRGIELVARMVTRNDVGDKSYPSPTLPEADDEQHIECGVVLTQPSQETRDDTDAEEPSFVTSNETMLKVEPVCRSVGVGDDVADTGFISGVDHLPIAIGFASDIDPSFIELEFMSE